MTSEVCDRCGQPAAHLFPDATTPSRICSRCYEALRLHRQGGLLTSVGLAAIGLGAALLAGVLLVLVLSLLVG